MRWRLLSHASLNLAGSSLHSSASTPARLSLGEQVLQKDCSSLPGTPTWMRMLSRALQGRGMRREDPSGWHGGSEAYSNPQPDTSPGEGEGGVA